MTRDLTVEQCLDEALWRLLQGDGRAAIDALGEVPPDTQWMDQVIRYVVQRVLMGDDGGAAGIFGGRATTEALLAGETLLGWMVKGLLQRFEGDYDSAAQSLVYAVELAATDPWAVGCLAMILLEAGIVDDALHLTSHARAHHREHPFLERVTKLVEAAFKSGVTPRS